MQIKPNAVIATLIVVFIGLVLAIVVVDSYRRMLEG